MGQEQQIQQKTSPKQTSIQGVNAYGSTDVGRKRSQNQDNFVIFPELAPNVGLFVVADGMGGHKGGETASAIAVEVITQHIRSLLLTNNGRTTLKIPAAEALVQAVETANASIFDQSMKTTSLLGMGTTVTAMLYYDKQVFFAQVGDSRAYFLQPGKIWQLTRDHSMVQEKLRAGIITREQLKTDKMRNVITRSCGVDAEVEVDLFSIQPMVGDTFLLCSDGLHSMAEDQEIMKCVNDVLFQKKDLAGTPKKLIELANSHGGDDNVSAILVQVY